MATDRVAALEDLRHDVNTKCSNLKTAATHLCAKPTDEEFEFVGLMGEQARFLVERIAAYEMILRGGRRK